MKHRLLSIPVIVCLAFMFALPVFANAAEPPCLTIVVVSAPDELSLVDADGAEVVQLEKLRSGRGWETYFRYFYNHSIREDPYGVTDVQVNAEVELTDLRLAVTDDGETTYLAMPALAYKYYNNVVMLDLDTMTVSRGLYPGRMVLIIGLRVALTLLIEGFLFWVFGYCQAFSWGMFFCLNILTQLGLNLLIGSASMDSYVLFFYYLLEGVIILAETIAFPLALREKRLLSIPYAILANLASMSFGGLMIANLPLAL